MESENDLEPPAESCQDGIGFYELRPYFAATHYGRDALPAGMALHMERCPACRERWQFLIDTDPKASAGYWDEVEDLWAKTLESERAAKIPKFPPVREAIADLAGSEHIPPIELVQGAWQAVRTLPDDVERYTESGRLATACSSLLTRFGKESNIVPYLMRLGKLPGTPVSLPVDVAPGNDSPALALLILASCAFTSCFREYAILEFGRNGVLFYPDQFRLAKDLFDRRSKEMEQAIR